MKMIKYSHACFTLDIDGQTLIIDPGADSTDLAVTDGVVGILITHEHSGHFSPERISTIRKMNPNVMVYEPFSIAKKIDNIHVLNSYEKLIIGAFKVKAFVGTHDLIHPEYATVPNIGYLINDEVFYGGDSLKLHPDIHPSVVMVPISGNWMRFSDAVNFVRDIHPTYAIPTHDRLLSDIGKNVADMHMSNLTKNYDITYKRLNEPLQINS